MYDEDGDEEQQLIMEFSPDFMFWFGDWNYRQGGVRITGGETGRQSTIILSITPYQPE